MTGILGAAKTKDAALIFQGAVFLVLGIAFSYFGYLSASADFNVDEVIGPALLWCAVLMLLLKFPLRSAAACCHRALSTRLGAAVFWLYLVAHLAVYGFLLEIILGSIYGITLALSPTIAVTTNAFVPPSVLNTIFDLAYSPSVIFTLPPALSGALSLYGFSVAVLVDVLVVANLAGVVELGMLRSLGRRARSYFLLPAVGLVLGASCCLSLPALISLGFPSVTAVASFAWIFTVTYFFFPTFALIILYLNAHSISRISDGLRRSPSADVPAQ